MGILDDVEKAGKSVVNGASKIAHGSFKDVTGGQKAVSSLEGGVSALAKSLSHPSATPTPMPPTAGVPSDPGTASASADPALAAAGEQDVLPQGAMPVDATDTQADGDSGQSFYEMLAHKHHRAAEGLRRQYPRLVQAAAAGQIPPEFVNSAAEEIQRHESATRHYLTAKELDRTAGLRERLGRHLSTANDLFADKHRGKHHHQDAERRGPALLGSDGVDETHADAASEAQRLLNDMQAFPALDAAYRQALLQSEAEGNSQPVDAFLAQTGYQTTLQELATLGRQRRAQRVRQPQPNAAPPPRRSVPIPAAPVSVAPDRSYAPGPVYTSASPAAAPPAAVAAPHPQNEGIGDEILNLAQRLSPLASIAALPLLAL